MPACLSLSHHATRARTPHHIILQLAKIHTNDTIRFTPDTLFTHDQIHTPRKRAHANANYYNAMEESERADGAPSKRAAFMWCSPLAQKTNDKDQNQEGGAVAERLLSGDAKPSWPPSESAG